MRAELELGRTWGRSSKIIASAGMTLGARLVVRAALVVFVVVLARLLPVQEYGRYAYLVALALTVAMLSDTGVSLASGREIARGRFAPWEAIARAGPVVGAAAVVSAGIVTALSVSTGAYALGWRQLVMLIAYVGANGAFNLLANVLRSAGRIGTEALLQIGSVGAFVASAIVVAFVSRSVDAIFLTFVAKEVVAALCALLLVRPSPLRRTTPRREGGPSQYALLRAGLTLAAGSGMLVGYTRMGLVVLGNLRDGETTGLYAAASRLLEMGVMLGSTLGFALAPGLARLAVADPTRARALALRVVGWCLLVTAVVGCSVALFRRDLVTLVFGRSYVAAAPPLLAFAAGLPAIVVAPLVGQLAVALGRDRTFLVTHGLGLVVVVLALVYTGGRSAGGAALATVFGFGAASLAGVFGLTFATGVGGRRVAHRGLAAALRPSVMSRGSQP